MRNTIVRVVALGAILAMLVACQPIQPASPAAEAPAVAAPQPELPVARPVESVLFIGNGMIKTACCLSTGFKDLAASATPPKEIAVKDVLSDNGTLETQYRYMPYLGPAAVKKGGNDVVVLQEAFQFYSEPNTDVFKEVSALFDADVRAAGGRTVLYLAQAVPDAWIDLEGAAAVHREVGEALGVDVAPAGLAIERAKAERPDLQLLNPEGFYGDVFPYLLTDTGMYLSALVLYATVFNEDPTGLPYHPEGMSDDDAAYLQGVAWQTVQEWNAQ